MKEQQYVVVAAEALPEMINKALEVKKLLARGGEKSAGAACKRVGISRSAYYKYRDSVFSYDDVFSRRIVTLYAVLTDEPGVLSRVLASLHALDANILTVNQNIPVDGAAAVTISMRLSGSGGRALAVVDILSELAGVADVRIISGE